MPAPTVSDVTTYLSERFGLTVTAGTTVAQILSGVLGEIDALTGWKPFISSGTPFARTYDPPAGDRDFIQLRSGLLTLSSVVVEGAALVNGSDFYLSPANAAAEGMPFTVLEFSLLRQMPSTRRSIVVTGVWGRFASWPADVFQAIVEIVAGRVLDAIRVGAITDSGVRWKDGDVEEDRSAVMASASEPIVKDAMASLRKYKNMQVFGG